MIRIEKRGEEEYLIGGPAEVNDCTAVRDGCQCNVHFDGQHISTGRPGADGAEYILARWPIEPAAAPAPAPLRPAEEIAREMVPEPDAGGRRTIGAMVEDIDRDALRSVIVRCIEQRDAEHAAALQAAQPRDLAGAEEAPEWDMDDMSNVRALQARGLIPAATEQPSDLAGRVRALVQEYAGRWADADDGASDEVLHDLMERLVQAVAFARRGAPLAALIDDMRAAHPTAADELEAIVRGCAEARWVSLGTVSSVGPCYRAGLIAALGAWSDDIAYSGGRIRVEQRRAGKRIAEWTWEGVDTFRTDGGRKVALFLRGEGTIEPGDELWQEENRS